MLLFDQEAVRHELKPGNLASASLEKVTTEISCHQGLGQAREGSVLGEGEDLFAYCLKQTWAHRVHFELRDPGIRKNAGETLDVALVVGVEKNLERTIAVIGQLPLPTFARHSGNRNIRTDPAPARVRRPSVENARIQDSSRCPRESFFSDRLQPISPDSLGSTGQRGHRR